MKVQTNEERSVTMKRIICLFLILLTAISLFGCTAAEVPSETTAGTVPPETTVPVETSEPIETAFPPETIQPPVTEPPTEVPAPQPEVEEVQSLIRTMMNAHLENMYLNTDHDFRDCTILALNDTQASQALEYKGEEIVISAMNPNIEFLFGKELYWKYHRLGISRTDYHTTFFFPEFTPEGSTLSLQVNINVGFRYTDSDTSSFDGLTFDIDLLKVDGQWYICEVTELYSSIDYQYQNDPDFDVAAFIIEYEEKLSSTD